MAAETVEGLSLNPKPNRLAQRRSGWERCFREAISRAQSRTFEFGRFDCCLWAADAVNAITGVDLAAELRGIYSTRAGAHAVIKARGGMERMIDDLCTAAGLVPCAPSLAHRGDVVLLAPYDGFPATLGVCLGAMVAAPGVPCGLTCVPISTALRAWHIQHAFKCHKYSPQS